MSKKVDKVTVDKISKNGVWSAVEKISQYAVVQVYSQVGKFNWQEPYKTGDQFENRGTGFFVNEHGYIVTNYHVISEAKVIWIQMPVLGRKIIHAYVVGFCPDSDIALLAISQKSIDEIKKVFGQIPVLAIGDSDATKRTDSVMVLGYPLGNHNLKSTVGIISGMESIGGITLLQVTAPINPGSSGGPVFSSLGEVIGIAVALDALAQNVGYALPINELKVIFKDLQKQRLLRKTVLGGVFHNSTDEQAKFLSNPVPSGYYIKDILKNSLMEKAGVKPGDMLYKFNGHIIDAFGEAKVSWSADRVILKDLISRLSIGQSVDIVIYRNGEKKQIKFKIEPPVIYPIREIFPGYEEIDYEVLGGMVIMELAVNHFEVLEDLNPFIVEYLKPENKVDPVLVITHIMPGSYAHQVRSLKPGDIISKVNGKKIGVLSEFRKLLKKSMESGVFSIETVEKTLAVFDFKAMLKDEINLAVSFAYPISEDVAKLIEKVEIKK